MRLPTTHDDPSTLLGGLVAFVGAVFAALVVFGVLDTEQAAALGAVLTTALPIVLAVAIRRHAWAPDTVRSAVDAVAKGVDEPGVAPDERRRRIKAAEHVSSLYDDR